MQKVVLILDHDPNSYFAVRSCLHLSAFRVIRTAHPDQAMRFAMTIKPTVFIVDMRPCGCSGIEFARALRSQGYGHTPMIAISDSPAILRVAALYELFNACVEKPLEVNHLAEQIFRFTDPQLSSDTPDLLRLRG